MHVTALPKAAYNLFDCICQTRVIIGDYQFDPGQTSLNEAF